MKCRSGKPTHQACQQQPGHMRRRLMPRPVHAIPRGGAIQGRQDRKGPGPCRERQLYEHRYHHPLVPPAIGRIPVGRPHPIAMPAFAEHFRARVLGDRIVASAEHRPRREYMVEQEHHQCAGQGPSRPPALGQHAMIGRDMPRCLVTNGTYQVADGASPRGQHGREHQDQKPVIRRSGKCGLKHAEYWDRTSWDIHGCRPFMGFTIAYPASVSAAISP